MQNENYEFDDEQQDQGEQLSSACTQCRRQLGLGEDIISVQFTVLGARGPVPLDQPLLFCDEECLLRHFSDEPPLKLPRRIP